jgi:hypothetical protein
MSSTGEQQVNKRKVHGASSKFFGVTWNKQKGKWYVRMTINYRQINIGLFVDEEEAGKQYLVAIKKHYGNNVRLKDQRLLGLDDGNLYK